MSEDIQIIQKSGVASETTQIGEQNNYYGLSPVEASQLTLQLFQDNFPKLQKEAADVAMKRAEELCNEVINRLIVKGKTDFTEFSDPDMQFILNKSQQEYARFGTQDLLALLSDLLTNRIEYNNDQYMKILLDQAVETAKSLTPAHLNYLSLIFICKQVKFSDINSIETLDARLKYICANFPVPQNIETCCSFLHMKNLLILNLGTPEERLSSSYGIKKDIIKPILPPAINAIPADYALSPLGYCQDSCAKLFP